ncbi:MAG: putative zinc-binding metallopeptidase [bacterium]
MSAANTASVLESWETTRYELLNTRISDLGLQVANSILEAYVQRFYRELERQRLTFRPICYLTDSWGCPNEVPIIGVPFYLADKRLMRIEEEQTGEIEDESTIMMFLRHEAGHAFNYAYRLWEAPGWAEVFGTFSSPYRDAFEPDPFSRQFVRHIVHSQYGRSYAQKHPDEDFAETFAVWLTPRSAWRRKYHAWPAMRKLQYVARLMHDVRSRQPVRETGPLLHPVEELRVLLAEHYGQRIERYRAAAQGYVDDKLRAVFPPPPGRGGMRAAALIHQHRADLLARVSRWSGLAPEDVETILNKLEARAAAIRLRCHLENANANLLDVTALATALAMDFGYTGRFTV